MNSHNWQPSRPRTIAAWVAVVSLLAAFLTSLTSTWTASAAGSVVAVVFLVVGLAALGWWIVLRRRSRTGDS